MFNINEEVQFVEHDNLKEKLPEKFHINEEVLISQHDNLRENPKMFKGKFLKKIMKRFENDSYYVTGNDKTVKKSHSDFKSCTGLKNFQQKETNHVSEGISTTINKN